MFIAGPGLWPGGRLEANSRGQSARSTLLRRRRRHLACGASPVDCPSCGPSCRFAGCTATSVSSSSAAPRHPSRPLSRPLVSAAPTATVAATIPCSPPPHRCRHAHRRHPAPFRLPSSHPSPSDASHRIASPAGVTNLPRAPAMKSSGSSRSSSSSSSSINSSSSSSSIAGCGGTSPIAMQFSFSCVQTGGQVGIANLHAGGSRSRWRARQKTSLGLTEASRRDASDGSNRAHQLALGAAASPSQGHHLLEQLPLATAGLFCRLSLHFSVPLSLGWAM